MRTCKMAKPYKYKGILAKPRPATAIELAHLLNPDDKELEAQAKAAYDKNRQDLMAALFEDCGAAAGELAGWVTVALTLASRHVPGFMMRPLVAKTGRPAKGTTDDAAVFLQVEAQRAKGHSVRAAAAHVARARRQGESAAAIDSQYRRAKAAIESAKAWFEQIHHQNKS
jgi:hypothetical protein